MSDKKIVADQHANLPADAGSAQPTLRVPKGENMEFSIGQTVLAKYRSTDRFLYPAEIVEVKRTRGLQYKVHWLRWNGPGVFPDVFRHACWIFPHTPELEAEHKRLAEQAIGGPDEPEEPALVRVESKRQAVPVDKPEDEPSAKKTRQSVRIRDHADPTVVPTEQPPISDNARIYKEIRNIVSPDRTHAKIDTTYDQFVDAGAPQVQRRDPQTVDGPGDLIVDETAEPIPAAPASPAGLSPQIVHSPAPLPDGSVSPTDLAATLQLPQQHQSGISVPAGTPGSSPSTVIQEPTMVNPAHPVLPGGRIKMTITREENAKVTHLSAPRLATTTTYPTAAAAATQPTHTGTNGGEQPGVTSGLVPIQSSGDATPRSNPPSANDGGSQDPSDRRITAPIEVPTLPLEAHGPTVNPAVVVPATTLLIDPAGTGVPQQPPAVLSVDATAPTVKEELIDVVGDGEVSVRNHVEVIDDDIHIVGVAKGTAATGIEAASRARRLREERRAAVAAAPVGDAAVQPPSFPFPAQTRAVTVLVRDFAFHDNLQDCLRTVVFGHQLELFKGALAESINRIARDNEVPQPDHHSIVDSKEHLQANQLDQDLMPFYCSIRDASLHRELHEWLRSFGELKSSSIKHAIRNRAIKLTRNLGGVVSPEWQSLLSNE